MSGVSLWDHCMVWGFCLHYCKFLSCLRKQQAAGRSLIPFLQSKALSNILTFIPTNAMEADQLRKSIRSALYPTTQYRPLSLIQLSKPWYYSTSTFPYPSVFLLSDYSLVSFNQASSNIFQLSEYLPDIFQPPPPHTVFQLWGGSHLSNHVDEKVRLRDCVTGTPLLFLTHHSAPCHRLPHISTRDRSPFLTFLGPSEDLRGGRWESCAVFSHSVVSDSLWPHRLCSPPGSSVYGDFPGKNTRVGSLSLLQGTFPTQGVNPGLLPYRWILYHLRMKWTV